MHFEEEEELVEQEELGIKPAEEQRFKFNRELIMMNVLLMGF